MLAKGTQLRICEHIASWIALDSPGLTTLNDDWWFSLCALTLAVSFTWDVSNTRRVSGPGRPATVGHLTVADCRCVLVFPTKNLHCGSVSMAHSSESAGADA